MKEFDEVCGNCGCTFGSHHAGSHHAGIQSYPKDYCPGHEGRMDWEEGPGTVFKPTNTFKERDNECKTT